MGRSVRRTLDTVLQYRGIALGLQWIQFLHTAQLKKSGLTFQFLVLPLRTLNFLNFTNRLLPHLFKVYSFSFNSMVHQLILQKFLHSWMGLIRMDF